MPEGLISVLPSTDDSDFGLASYLFTRDLSRAWRIMEALEYGMIGINTGQRLCCANRVTAELPLFPDGLTLRPL